MSSQKSGSSKNITYVPNRHRPRPVRNTRKNRDVTVRSITFRNDWSKDSEENNEYEDHSPVSVRKDLQHQSGSSPTEISAKVSKSVKKRRRSEAVNNDSEIDGETYTEHEEGLQLETDKDNNPNENTSNSLKNKNIYSSLRNRSKENDWQTRSNILTSVNKSNEGGEENVSLSKRKKHNLTSDNLTTVEKESNDQISKLSKRRASQKRFSHTIDDFFTQNVTGNKSTLKTREDVSSDHQSKLSQEEASLPEKSNIITPKGPNVTLGTSRIGLPQVTSTPRVNAKMSQRPRLTGEMFTGAPTPASGPAIRRKNLVNHSTSEFHVTEPMDKTTPVRVNMSPKRKKILPQEKLKGVSLLVNEDGGTTSGRNVTDLDVIIQIIHKSTERFRMQMESRVCKKAITIFAEDLMGELTETVTTIQKLKKMLNSFNRNKTTLVKKRDQLSAVRKEFRSLNSEVKSLQQGRSPSFKPEKHFFRQMRAMQSQFEESHISEHKQGDREEVLYHAEYNDVAYSGTTHFTQSNDNLIEWLHSNYSE